MKRDRFEENSASVNKGGSETESQSDTITRVIAELSYYPSLRVNRDVCEFQAKVCKDHHYEPLPRQDPFDSSWINGYQFTRSAEVIRLFENRLAIEIKEYPGFGYFSRRIIELAMALKSCFGIDSFNRLGLRYQNVLYFEPLDGKYPIAEKIFPHLNFEHPDVQQQQKFYLELEMQRPFGGLTCRSSFRRDTISEGEYAPLEFGVYILDLDAFQNGTLESTALSETLTNLHEDVKKTYNRHVRDKEIQGIVR